MSLSVINSCRAITCTGTVSGVSRYLPRYLGIYLRRWSSSSASPTRHCVWLHLLVCQSNSLCNRCRSDFLLPPPKPGQYIGTFVQLVGSIIRLGDPNGLRPNADDQLRTANCQLHCHFCHPRRVSSALPMRSKCPSKGAIATPVSRTVSAARTMVARATAAVVFNSHAARGCSPPPSPP